MFGLENPVRLCIYFKCITLFADHSPEPLTAVRNLIIIKCFRPDRLIQATAAFASEMFQTDLAEAGLFDLRQMVADEVPATTPLALVSVTGYDASFRVENLVTSSGAKCQSVAMGSQEGFTHASKPSRPLLVKGHGYCLRMCTLPLHGLANLRRN
jgi:dynein heavy chain 1, cytosolic